MKRNKFEWNDGHCIYTIFPQLQFQHDRCSHSANLCSYVIILIFFIFYKNGQQNKRILYYEQQQKQSMDMASAGSKDFYIY